MNHTVAVFGATGAQGAPVVREALKRGYDVRAVARDADKISKLHPTAMPVAASFEDAESLTKALSGVDAAFVHLPAPQSPEDPARWMQNLFSAAHKSALPLLVFSTTGTAGDRYPSATLIDANNATMNAVLGSGIPSIVLHPTIYLENLKVDLLVPSLKSEGILDYPPLPADQVVSWTSHEDQARIAAAALSRPDLAGRSFEIASHGAVDGGALAELLQPWIQREATFAPATPNDFGDRVGAVFQSPAIAALINELYTALSSMESGAMTVDTQALEDVFKVELGSVQDHISTW